MTGVYVCSLANKLMPQSIPAGGWHVLNFPFGKNESWDHWNMHQVAQPDGVKVDSDWMKDDRSGLIWPTVYGWATLTAMIHWEDGDYTAVEDQFCRDPLGLKEAPDTTATQSHVHVKGVKVPLVNKWLGGSGRTLTHATHEMFVHPGVPVAVRVMHDSKKPLKIVVAEFKMAIHEVAEPGKSLADLGDFPSP